MSHAHSNFSPGNLEIFEEIAGDGASHVSSAALAQQGELFQRMRNSVGAVGAHAGIDLEPATSGQSRSIVQIGRQPAKQ